MALSARGRRPHACVWWGIAIGLAAYLLLPWYAIQDTSWYEALPGVFGADEVANGVLQALHQDRSWLWIGISGLAICTAAALLLVAAFGLARMGLFRGDLFVSAAVLNCAALMALFIGYPVLKALASAFMDDDAPSSVLRAAATRPPCA